MVHPIWKDYIVDFGISGNVGYQISYINDGKETLIYNGRAINLPNEATTKVRINDICGDWLSNIFPSIESSFSRQNLPVEFVVKRLTGVIVEIARVRFVNDWSYDPNYDVELQGMAVPINKHIDIRQWLLWTGLDVSEVEAKVTLKDGSSFHVYIPVAISADFNADFNSDFARSVRIAGSGTAVFQPSQWGDVVEISIGGIKYQVVQGCFRYVLYYRNAHGGWDSFLAEGASVERDSLIRHTINRAGAFDRQKSNYLNEIEKKITLNTSWLSDEESMRMHHLLNSPDVYLHDLTKDIIYPVLVDSKDIEYKTYLNQGGKLVNYRIEVTIAQNRRRK